MWGAIHFSQMDLMLGSGDTSLSWKFDNALLTKKYIIHVNYSSVSRQYQKVYLVCVLMYDILCNIFVLFMCLDVFEAVHLSCRQKTVWCVDYDEISRKTSPKRTWLTCPKCTFQPHRIFHEKKEDQAPVNLSVRSSELVLCGAHEKGGVQFALDVSGSPQN